MLALGYLVTVLHDVPNSAGRGNTGLGSVHTSWCEYMEVRVADTLVISAILLQGRLKLEAAT